eukprot:1354123-Amorphochlora_amoeboformis.AAC.1
MQPKEKISIEQKHSQLCTRSWRSSRLPEISLPDATHISRLQPDYKKVTRCVTSRHVTLGALGEYPNGFRISRRELDWKIQSGE